MSNGWLPPTTFFRLTHQHIRMSRMRTNLSVKEGSLFLWFVWRDLSNHQVPLTTCFVLLNHDASPHLPLGIFGKPLMSSDAPKVDLLNHYVPSHHALRTLKPLRPLALPLGIFGKPLMMSSGALRWLHSV